MTTTVDFDADGTTLLLTGESLCEVLDVMPDERVLDVAAGIGNASLAAARRGAEVTTSDYAAALAFPDASFDVVLSTFGAMFAPQPERVAAELVRVCRPGGRVGLANWSIGVRDREFVFRYRSSRAWLDAFRRFYGPTHTAFSALDRTAQTALGRDLLVLADTHNTSTTGWRVPSPYLEVVIVKAS